MRYAIDLYKFDALAIDHAKAESFDAESIFDGETL